MWRIFLFVQFAYLSGSVLYAYVFAGLFHKEDLFRYSRDENPGTANAFLYGGFWCGACTLCGDVLKGFLPVHLFERFGEGTPEWALTLVLVAPVIGHIFPIFHRFQGGKGIAVTFGCLLGLFPYSLPFVIFAGIFIFLSLGLRIRPHFYRTFAAYLCTAAAFLILKVHPAVCTGFLLIAGIVCVRMHMSKEEREKLEVKLLWMR